MNKNQLLVQKLLLCAFLSLCSTPVHAYSCPLGEITPDNTLGTEASKLTANVLINGATADLINGGAQRGNNLFHSFTEFNIKEGQGVYFANPSGVVNILTRVTGGNASNILGTLGVDGGANLFLINPNGILFGKNASLDLRGSFVGTTANGVQFGNQGNFSATEPLAPGLLTINPSALFFNQINPNAAIVNNSVAPAGIDPAGFETIGLQVPNGKSLLLVGGNVSMDGGQLNAYGGRVELGGLAEAGNINLLFDGNNLSLGFPENVTRASVSLRNQARVYVEASGGGDIAINAHNIEILGGSRLISGIGEGLGAIETIAGDVTLIATGAIFLANAGILNTVNAGGVGKGGNININAASLSLRDGAQLITSTLKASDTQGAGRGDAGNVNVKVTGEVDITGKTNIPSAIFSLTQTGTKGNGGNIIIDADSFRLTDGAQLIASSLGQGSAGNVTVIAKDTIVIASDAGILSTLEGSVGQGGNIDINARTLTLLSGAELTASTFGQGNAGSITITAKDAISLVGDAYIFSTVEPGGVGRGGNININATKLTLQDGAQIQAIIRRASGTKPAGKGSAGNINIKAIGEVNLTGKKNEFKSAIGSAVEIGTEGNGGNIAIDAGFFRLLSGAQLEASTYGTGNAGNVTVAATGILLDNASILSIVGAGGTGKGGNIDINAGFLSLQEGAQVQTLISRASRTQPAGKGSAGNVNVNVTGEVDIAGEKDTFLSGIRSDVGIGTEGNGGNISINANSFKLRDSAQIIASTRGQGNAGNISINAKDTVIISGTSQDGFSSALFTDTNPNSIGVGGDITVNTNTFRVSNGAIIDARTENNNRGGNITVNTNIFEAFNGGQFTTTTSSNGRAGKITVNAADKVIISYSDLNYNDRIANFPNRVPNIGANAGFFVNSTGSGTTGDIEINSPNITLDNQGKIQANSASDNGGNIKLNSDLLLLRRGAQISTNAGTQQKGGDGGNIDINSRFIVAVPTENSDITANAFTGKGGNVNIRAQGIFGIEPRATESPQTSDITASSDRGVQGQISITEPDVEPEQGLIELPEEVVDATRRVAQICPREPGAKPLGEFTITGRGSLPPSPLEALPGTTNTTKLATLDSNNTNVSNIVPDKVQNEIVEAQSWIKNTDGSMELVAMAPTTTRLSHIVASTCPF